MKRIFLVEDDLEIAKNLMRLLHAEGFGVVHAPTQRAVASLLAGNPFDLALVDISLPDGNGFAVCTEIKQAQDIPVIFLTASGDEASVVTGLNMGADDYITKPFRVRELISRMNSVLRRAGKKQAETTINYQDLSINTIAARVFKNNQEVFLTGMEYRLLLILATHRNQVMTRDQLFEAIWDLGGEYVNDNTLTVYIKRLREKLEDDPAHPQLIRTIRGLGYKLGE